MSAEKIKKNLGITDEEMAEAQHRLADMLDTCAQCGMPIPFSYTGRDDLLCEYHASE